VHDGEPTLVSVRVDPAGAGSTGEVGSMMDSSAQSNGLGKRTVGTAGLTADPELAARTSGAAGTPTPSGALADVAANGSSNARIGHPNLPPAPSGERKDM